MTLVSQIKALMTAVAFATVVYVPARAVSKPNDKTAELHPTESEQAACRLVVKMLGTDNYKKVALDDSLSVLVFERYLKGMDQNRSYLMASDVAGFIPYKTHFDEDLRDGNLSAAFAMYNTYKIRYEERFQYAIKQLLNNFNFSVREIYTPDHRKLPFIRTQAEMDKLWRQRVKYDLLELQLAKPDLLKNKEILRKRYQALLNQSARTSSQDVFQLFMTAFTASVDPHVAYFTPFNSAQFSIEASRALEGIGAALALENEFVTIKTITAGGPAYKTRMINPDDRILAIAQGKDGEFQDIFGWRLDDAIALIRGPKGTTVKLKLLAKGKTTADAAQIVEVLRDKIILEDQSAKQEVRSYKVNGRDLKIGVISIPGFYMDYAAAQRRESNYKSTTRDVKLLLDTLKQKMVDGIMIDLRGNGGGSLNEVISLTGLFIHSGPVVQVKDLSQKIQVYEDRDTSVYYNGPLAVLVDRRSASASEIFAAAIQDYGRGLILGSQTYGKGTVQAQVNLDRDLPGLTGLRVSAPGVAKTQDKLGQLNVTTGKFYRITGSSTQHKGVSPDIEMQSFIATSKYGEDNEPSALPWDTIRKSEYVKLGSLDMIMPVLTNMYKTRNQRSQAYKAYGEMIGFYQEHEFITTVPLNVKEFKLMRDQNAAATLAQSNKLRTAIGLPVLKAGEIRTKTDDLDFMKLEAGRILTDFIFLNTNRTR
ncbi:carboxy terminal-processing peptidase [Pedobacter sp. MC2016-14]|uniref:carboxy terminal-processing peptidase n=1 Tax=Pedobacter sp. MC2016-14 TaxID=2897327 RepID=UPI001E482F67|nr:carboxy terminal-processing peptidase [Pedobacter sp. MC2016-14]MCD0487804.1 carboxy terminal-processing peptidase [Pedobacter sp. MC2016-14]